jgi:hypothetical protein
VDAFKALAIQLGNNGYAGQSATIVQLLLTDHGWPASDIYVETVPQTRDIDTSPPASSTPVLSVLQEIDASEGGLFFMSRDGIFTFYNHSHVALYPPIAGEVWGDEYIENQYQSITFDTNENAVYNEVQVDSTSGPAGSVNDYVSQAKYLRRRNVISTNLQTQAQAQERAFEYILQFGVPRTRVTRLEVGVREDADWSSILAKDLLDRIVVRRRPYEGLPGIHQDSVIQGINISSTNRKQWNVTWRLTATPQQNRLTANQAGFETDTSGWVAVTNCALARVTTGPPAGNSPLASMRLTPTITGDMAAETTPNTQMSVSPGRSYSGMAFFWSTGSFSGPFRTCRVDIRWRDIAGSVIGTTTGTPVLEDPFSTQSIYNSWMPAFVAGFAPTGAFFATMAVNVLGAAEAHLVDLMGFYDIEEQYAWTPGMG